MTAVSPISITSSYHLHWTFQGMCMESKGPYSQDMKILETQRLSNTNHQDTASMGGDLHSGTTLSNLAWSLKPTLGTITLIPSIIKTGASSLDKPLDTFKATKPRGARDWRRIQATEDVTTSKHYAYDSLLSLVQQKWLSQVEKHTSLAPNHTPRN